MVVKWDPTVLNITLVCVNLSGNQVKHQGQLEDHSSLQHRKVDLLRQLLREVKNLPNNRGNSNRSSNNQESILW